RAACSIASASFAAETANPAPSPCAAFSAPLLILFHARKAWAPFVFLCGEGCRANEVCEAVNVAPHPLTAALRVPDSSCPALCRASTSPIPDAQQKSGWGGAARGHTGGER